jgi:hypothetical protein
LELVGLLKRAVMIRYFLLLQAQKVVAQEVTRPYRLKPVVLAVVVEV